MAKPAVHPLCPSKGSSAACLELAAASGTCSERHRSSCPGKWCVLTQPGGSRLGGAWLALSSALCSGPLLNRQPPILYLWQGRQPTKLTPLCHPGGWQNSDTLRTGTSISAAICQHMQHWRKMLWSCLVRFSFCDSGWQILLQKYFPGVLFFHTNKICMCVSAQIFLNGIVFLDLRVKLFSCFLLQCSVHLI